AAIPLPLQDRSRAERGKAAPRPVRVTACIGGTAARMFLPPVVSGPGRDVAAHFAREATRPAPVTGGIRDRSTCPVELGGGGGCSLSTPALQRQRCHGTRKSPRDCLLGPPEPRGTSSRVRSSRPM